MNLTKSIFHFNKPHLNFLIDVVRVITGLIIFLEGIAFIHNSELLYHIVENSRIGGFALILEHHVAFTLLAGGVLIIIGLVTRIAILFQFPVFIGVLLNPHAQYGLYSVYGNQTFSIIVLILLITLFLSGSGKFSADYRFKYNKIK